MVSVVLQTLRSSRAKLEAACLALAICSDDCRLWWCFQAVVLVWVWFGLVAFFSPDGRGSCSTSCSAALGLILKRADVMGVYSREAGVSLQQL